MFDSVEQYDIAANAWTMAPNLIFGRCKHSGCSLNNFIYIFCGQSLMGTIDTIEYLDAQAWIDGKKDVTW